MLGGLRPPNTPIYSPISRQLPMNQKDINRFKQDFNILHGYSPTPDPAPKGRGVEGVIGGRCFAPPPNYATSSMRCEIVKGKSA